MTTPPNVFMLLSSPTVLMGVFWLLLAFFVAASAILVYHWKAYAFEPKKMLVAAYLFFAVAFVLIFIQATALLAL